MVFPLKERPTFSRIRLNVASIDNRKHNMAVIDERDPFKDRNLYHRRGLANACRDLLSGRKNSIMRKFTRLYRCTFIDVSRRKNNS